MKRSSLVIIVALAALAGFAIYTYVSRSPLSTVDEESRDFKYEDTASITSIFIADKEGNKSLLKRTSHGWVVNDKFPCRSEAILNLMEAIRHVEVKMSVPRGAWENVIKFMSFNALKVEIYAGDELVKQYYVGHETPDAEATYMLLSDPETGENYRDPYICFIPGFVGYLQPRYIANENEWRDRLVLNYTPPEIQQIAVKHLKAPADSSFTIELLNTTTFRLRDGSGRDVAFDEQKLRQYLVYYQNISYEGLITGKNKKLQDSLQQAGPFCEISVTGKNYKTDVFKFYRKAHQGDVNPELGVKYEFDPDRLYLSFADGKEWAIAQYFVFGKLLVNTGYFRPGNSVKK
jgi:hypothetical protein